MDQEDDANAAGKPGRRNRFIRAVTGTTAAYVLIIIMSGPIIYLFGFRDLRFFLVPSASMEPTLYRQDCLITLRQDEYHRGDIIVLRDPEELDGYLVKRLIGIGGDAVAVEAGALFINDEYVSEPYVLSPPQYQMERFVVPEGEIFVLGDNRNNSDDGHAWPRKTVPENTIVGRVCLIYYPYARAGMVKSYFMSQPMAAEVMTSKPAAEWKPPLDVQ